MSNPTRPKPRPRARPRAAVSPLTTDVPPSSSPGPSSAVALSQQPTLHTFEDEDAMFLRNQTRTAQMWSHLSKLTTEKESKKRKSESSDDSDCGLESSQRRNRKNKNRPQRTKNDALPDWTRKRPDEIVVSSESDDDIVVAENDRATVSDNRSTGLQAIHNRARSRSITPPPALPQVAIQRAREAVQRLVGPLPRAASPSYGADDTVDTIILDPELAKIAQQVHTDTQMQERMSANEIGGPEVVDIKVIWKPHPTNPNGQSEAWGFRQKRHDNFYKLFGEVADSASILLDNLVVTYEGKRIFPSSNPHGIGIWAEAELEASDKITYQYLQETKRFRSPSVVPQETYITPNRGQSVLATVLSDSESGDDERAARPDPDGGDNEESNAFHLTIRSSRTNDKNISLLVRPTTKCGAIVRAFLKKAGLEHEYPNQSAPTKGRGRGAPQKVPMLSVDGDRMDADTEIGAADLEDGDQVEVVGL